MKINKFFNSLALGALFCGALASCSNDMDRSDLASNDMLLRAPKAKAYAGDTPLTPGKSFLKTRSGAEVTARECFTTSIDREKESAFVEERLPEQNGNIDDSMSTEGLFYAEDETVFELYPVYSQTGTPNDLGVFYIDTDGVYHEVIVWEQINIQDVTKTDWSTGYVDDNGQWVSVPTVTSKGVEVTIPAGCTFGFFWKGHTNTAETVYYSDPEKNEEVDRTDGNGNTVGGTSKIHAVTFEHNGQTYLGLEDWTDFDYQDWVFTCNITLKKKSEANTGDDNNGDDNDDNNGDDNGDNGDDNGDNNGDNNGDVTPENPTPSPETPEVPGIGSASNEIEVNLALDKKESDVLESHLSIHVRKATDVEIFIPVPAQYYCKADDMEIVMKHEGNHMAHGGPTEFTWTLKDSELQVSLYVQYEEGGIRVWTDGITQEVIDWCYEKCQDGITFEVWNYFNDPETGLPYLSADELKKYLDQATIKFLDEVPDYYVNSFGPDNDKYSEENPGGNDFHVTPESPDYFNTQYEGSHKNGFDHNDIYTNVEQPEEEAPAPPMPPTPPVY